jgi:hypothetical protein
MQWCKAYASNFKIPAVKSLGFEHSRYRGLTLPNRRNLLFLQGAVKANPAMRLISEQTDAAGPNAEKGMDVSRTDCGGITAAGEYEFRDGHLIVTPYQIAIWTSHPPAIFTAVEPRLSIGLKLYVLAHWRLPASRQGQEEDVR